jgi:hypothetical protein
VSGTVFRARRFAVGVALVSLAALSAAASAQPPGKPAAVAKATPSTAHPQRESSKAEAFYAGRWGITDLRARSTNAGNLIRFSYRVVDPELAKALNEKHNTPAMVAPRTRVVLQVPIMEKVGPLRQAMTPEAGKEYWMVFSNKGNFVKPGDRVNVMIGSFHADNLLVE